MKIVKSCTEVKPAKPTFDLAAFEASLKPGDVFYRKSFLQDLGLWPLMRTTERGGAKYVALLNGFIVDSLSGSEYVMAPDATMVLNIKD